MNSLTGMIIEYDFSRYVVHSEQPIKDALELLKKSKERIILCISSGKLEGVLTNGDFLRWVSREDIADLTTPVSEVMNIDFVWADETKSANEIQKLLDKRNYIPILREDRKLIGVARRRKRQEHLEIGRFRISNDGPTFIIAEIGNNHNGSIDHAKRLVDMAVEAGADCAKFQMRNMKALYQTCSIIGDFDSENLGTQYTLELLNKYQLTDAELFEIFDYCKAKGILPLCTPWDEASLEMLEKYGMPAYKVASADMTNHEFLERIAKTGKPMICSTGMATHREIVETVKVLQEIGAQYVLLHCNSTYPAPFSDIQLKYMDKLREIGSCIVGYSGHERGYEVPIAAVAMGARVIEKHFSTDKTMEGVDHKISLIPHEFKEMVHAIRNVEEAMGCADDRTLSQGEMMNRMNLAKSLIANCDIQKGEIINVNMIDVKSPGKGLQPNYRNKLIDRAAKRTIRKGEFFYPSDLEQGSIKAKEYDFPWIWGIPVRYHDFESLTKTCPHLKLVEFHLSFKDLEADIRKYLKQNHYNFHLAVHSPELFSSDHVLDLVSNDDNYLKRSLDELLKTTQVTRKLSKFFLPDKMTPLIVNVGGFTSRGPLSKEERVILYDRLMKNLSKVDLTGIELLPQTMPPFPWHIGGQQYHNLFVDADEIVDFCKKTGMRICFDVSHSKLACNYFGWSFYEFTEKVLPYTAHFHFADAKGKDGEGLQIGEGELDFKLLYKQMFEHKNNYTFIPEIWQGHENQGEGFWKALSILENEARAQYAPR